MLLLANESRASDGKRGVRLHRLTSLINNPAASLPIRVRKRVDSICGGIVVFSLAIYALFAPHSIAITQAASLLGLTAWCVRLAANGSFRLRRTPVDVAILGFFACCVLSSFLSYDPLVSIKGLKSPAFFFAFYLVSNNVRSARFARFLVFALVGSCLINVAYSAGQLAAGRGLRIDSISADSPLTKTGLMVGDIILQADDQKVNTLEDLSRIIDNGRGVLRIKYQRTEAVAETSFKRQTLRGVLASGVGLGLTTSPGRNFRVSGFFSHYETYAEVLQLIAALAIGLFLAHPRKTSAAAVFLASSVVFIGVALVMTSTRAVIAGLAIAVFAMAVASSRRRAVMVATAGILILAPAALFVVERSRGISVLDPQEESTAWRLEVWREAFGIIKDHPAVGIGKGSEAKLKQQLGLYDEGKLPPGHFHSTPIQIATWWGLPALVFYFATMTILAVMMLRASRRLKAAGQWDLWGIQLGCLGALIAFNVSSLVHFNFGDGEVVMAFWMLTGLAFAVQRLALRQRGDSQSEHTSALPAPGSSHRSLPLAPATTSESSARAAKVKQS
jgi:hypothetical protein